MIDKHRRDDPPDHFALFIDAASGFKRPAEVSVDNDGDGWFSGSGGDCDDTDANVYPGNGCPF